MINFIVKLNYIIRSDSWQMIFCTELTKAIGFGWGENSEPLRELVGREMPDSYDTGKVRSDNA